MTRRCFHVVVRRSASALLLLLVMATAGAQTGRAPAGLGRAGTDTERYGASASAATRAIALCSGLWSANQTLADIDAYSPLTPEDAASFETIIDDEERTVTITYADDMPPRIVVWRPVLGCTQLPVGASMQDRQYLPQVAAGVRPPGLDDRNWPLGDRNATGTLPAAKQTAIDALVDDAITGAYGGNSWGVIVVSGEKIVSERYAMGYDLHKGGQTHSAAKSFAASVVGVAVDRYGMDLDRPGALAGWRERPGDPRGQITADHLLRMNSGLYGEGNGSPQADIYANGATVEGRAVTNILHTMPGARFVYNPPDTMLLIRAVRETVADDSIFWALPFTELFWRIGMTRTTPSSDWNGDFLMSGQTYSTARDFARFGLLYLNEGEFDGERILPEGWHEVVSTPSGAQPLGDGARYGGQFWLYGPDEGLPTRVYGAQGGMGQYIMIIPELDAVVVRRGYDAARGFRLTEFLADVIQALE
jgi:CubicO group peptidase (beta-lactamase class C family)